MSFLSRTSIMPVNLNNIQFYHGPSKPAKPPSFALKSNQTGSNPMLSVVQLASLDEPVSTPTDNSTVAQTCLISPAANTDDSTHQHAVGSPNMFDFELARSWGPVTPLLNTRDASAKDACPSLRELDNQHQDGSNDKIPPDDSSTLGVSPSKCTELDDPGLSLRLHAICTSPLLPQSPIAELSPEPATAPDVVRSHVEEGIQWRQDAYSEPFTPAHSWCTSDVSAEFREHSPNTPLSSTSLCSNSGFSKRDDRGSCYSSPEDCPGDFSGDDGGASHAGLIPDCSPRTVAESGHSGPMARLHIDMPDLMDLEQSARCASVRSHSRTRPAQVNMNPGYTIPRKSQRKERPLSSTRKQGRRHKKCHPSVAVIPPSRPRPVRSVRSKTKPVPSDVNENESSEGFDDSSDEDFTIDSTQSESDIEDSLEEKHGPPSTAARCHPHDTSASSSTSHLESRDIVGRAILTIEMQGSEPTFFFKLVPDNVCSTSYVPAQRLPGNSKKPGRIFERSTSTARPTRGKGKHRAYSTHENHLLVKLKEERKLTWEEIAGHFPGRTSSALQVHYCTKLRHRGANKSRTQSRRGKKK